MFTWLRNRALPPLRFYNTLSRKTETFSPLSGRGVKMYNCGPTVYDRQHVGNMRPYVFADTLRRTLERWDYRVTQVVNITDVGHLVSDSDEGEDKMEASAQKTGRSAQDIAREYTDLFFNDLDALGVDRSRITFPRATEYIEEQIRLVQTLEEKGYAYRLKDGIYFDTSRFPAYGALGQIHLAGLQAGARVEENPEKRNSHDFALWKFSGKTKRQQEWESPWGTGFPGWHLECTAMIFALLGKQIDIHTGGVDHIPVHHNNEIAQAQGATGKPYVKYWMHNEFITIDGRKVSKSLGNTVYLSDVIARGIAPLSLRYWFLTAHYRSPANFTWEALEGAHAARERLLRHFDELGEEEGVPDEVFMRDFLAALGNDLDTPKALARLWDFAKDATVSRGVKRASLLEADKLLVLGCTQPREARANVSEDDVPAEVRELLDGREKARAARNFAHADALRARLRELGYEITDTPEGRTITRLHS